MRELHQRLREIRSTVEERLRAAVRPEPGFPEPLREAMAYSLLAPGKRLRPGDQLLTTVGDGVISSRVEKSQPAAQSKG